MADDETLAALAAQVDQLRGELSRLSGIVAGGTRGLETEGIGASLVLRPEVKRLGERLTEAATQDPARRRRPRRAGSG